MNKFHQEVLAEIKRQAGKGAKRTDEPGYMGTRHLVYPITVPVCREIIKTWVKGHKDISFKDFVELLNSLNNGKSHQELEMIGKLLELFPEHRAQIELRLLDDWLDRVLGWAEVDSICQNVFQAEEVLAKWSDWEKLITEFSKDKNIYKRRASLVLLTGPVHYSSDRRLARLAIKVVDILRNEEDILITKAISWLLRSLIKNHRELVEKYLESDAGSLPKIAAREVMNKLKSGRKSGK